MIVFFFREDMQSVPTSSLGEMSKRKSTSNIYEYFNFYQERNKLNLVEQS